MELQGMLKKIVLVAVDKMSIGNEHLGLQLNEAKFKGRYFVKITCEYKGEVVTLFEVEGEEIQVVYTKLLCDMAVYGIQGLITKK